MTIAREAHAVQRPDIVAWLVAYADALAANKDYLTQLDSAIGDADHGINMDRGFQAVAAAAYSPAYSTTCRAGGGRHRRDPQGRRHDADLNRRRGQRTALRHALPGDGGGRRGEA